MTDVAIRPVEDTERRELALLKAVGLDRLAPEQRELAIHISRQYDLDLMLKHLVMIEGRPYVTRDALLFIAHRSGQFDGIEVTTPEIVGDEWRCTATVWRKDFSHPFTYGGRYPTKGGNQKFAPEMAIKVAESMALRRAFNVAAPVVEERWDLESPPEDTTPVVKPTLAEIVAEKSAPKTLADAITAAAELPEPGLSGDEFKSWMDAHPVNPSDAQAIAHGLFPDQPKGERLSDAQRYQLRNALAEHIIQEEAATPVGLA